MKAYLSLFGSTCIYRAINYVYWARPFFIALGQCSGFEWAWIRSKFQVCDLIPKAQLLFPNFGMGGFYSCVILEVGGVSHYVCVIILRS